MRQGADVGTKYPPGGRADGTYPCKEVHAMKSVMFMMVVLFLFMGLPLMADNACTPGGDNPASVDKPAPASAPVKGVHIAFTVPLWLLAGFGSIAYPSIGAFIASFLMRVSNRRLPAFLVATMSFLWPATISAAMAAFPVWLAYSLTTQYGGAIKGVLSRSKPLLELARFCLHQKVRVTQNCLSREGASIIGGNSGIIRSQDGPFYKVDFNACGGGGVYWIKQDDLMQTL